ncbi:MAG: TetR/AcrR family transcriptional regulator [Bacteriovorax sp.]|nr:TetR/AcrR family transcriptional regulator [Bacteriovorax sp.]
MAVAKKLGRPTEVDKNKIIKVARSLFAEHGFTGASIRQIAEKADCNVAMIGYYFGSKEGLLDQILDNYFLEIVKVYSHFNQNLDQESDDISLALEFPEFKDPEIRQFCKALCEFASFAYSHREIHQIMIRDSMSGGKMMLNALVKNDYGVVPHIHKQLRQFIADKKLPEDTDIHIVGISLTSPVICSCISTQVATKIHGIDKIDDQFFRRLYVHHVRNLFSTYKNL